MFNAYYITRVSLPGWLVAGTKGLGFKSPQQQFSGHCKIDDIGILYRRPKRHFPIFFYSLYLLLELELRCRIAIPNESINEQ